LIGAMGIAAQLPQTPAGKLSKKALVDERADTRSAAAA
jgi:hypothetical protein